MNALSIEPVKLVAAVLYQNSEDFELAKQLMSDAFSRIDYEGDAFPFVESDYYEAEMGAKLKRLMISFDSLVMPDQLVKAKQTTQQLEKLLANQGNRTANMDIGYLDIFKLILASYKGRGNKIYMGEQIWADMILYFEKGDYQPFVWSFPDFKSGIYNKDLKVIRNIYKNQLKEYRVKLKNYPEYSQNSGKLKTT